VRKKGRRVAKNGKGRRIRERKRTIMKTKRRLLPGVSVFKVSS
jgi:hypothetical protein